MDTDNVVVGVDGSDSSWHAVRWAAAETRRVRGRLRIVLAHRWRPAARLLASEGSDDIVEAQADLIVDEAVAAARAAAPGIEVEGLSVQANPTSALLEAATDARLAVVGSRGRGGFASLLLGSVSLQVATHAPCSVAVVRGRPDAATGPVVVGVNGSRPASLAVRLAFEQAAARSCALVAAHAYDGAVSPSDPRADNGREDLIPIIAPWSEKYPQVPVEYVLVEGHPGQVLIALSHTAQLAVVGARGLGGFTGLLLGSTGQQLIHHADCPVLIARTRADP